MTAEKRLYAQLRSFSKGINSDLDPILIPPDQLSFATNATMRGCFVTQRPAFFNLTLIDMTGGDFQSGLFQGACYYRQGSNGSIMCAVNGKLFQITIAGQYATVTTVPIPQSNSATAVRNALWQAEQFLIWSDGVNLPMFWDGSGIGWSGAVARRSLGPTPVQLGIIGVAETAPTQNQSVGLTLTADWTSGSRMVLINAALYNVVGWSNSGDDTNIQTLGLQAVSAFTSGASIVAGATASSTNGYAGFITSATTPSVHLGNTPITPVAITTFTAALLSDTGIITDTVVRNGTTYFTDGNIRLVGPGFVWSASYPGVSYAYAAPGCNFTINGHTCTFSTVAYDADNVVISFKFTTDTQADMNAILEASTLNWVFPTNFAPGSTGNIAIQYYTTTGANIGGTVTLVMSESFQGAVGDILSVGSGGGLTTLQVISFSGTNVVCVVLTGSGNAIPFQSAGMTSAQVVTNTTQTSPVLSTVGLYPASSPAVYVSVAGVVASIGLLSTGITVGELISIPTSAGNVVFAVTGVSGGGTGTTPTILAININDTEGKIIPVGTVVYSIPELPVCTVGCYGMGRNWVALQDGVSYVAGDLVGSSTGSSQFNFNDAVLAVSQNYFLAGGGTFKISGSGETIQAMQFVAQLDASLGQGPLQIFTDDTVFSNFAPADMSTWSTLTSPIQAEGLIGSGAISQDAVVQQNNDLIFRLANGGVQSMLMASQNFNQWGNTPISKEISRSISGDDPTLLPWCSMVCFNNRLLMTCKFVDARPSGGRGVYGSALVALNFDPISSLAGKAPTIWEGEWDGLNVLQLIQGVFNGAQQCYALCLAGAGATAKIQIVQIQADGAATLDNGTQPVAWSFESPMQFKEPDSAARSRIYKRLINGEFSVKDITANVSYQVFYRSDQNPNWTLWYGSTIVYQGASDPGYRRRVSIGEPNPKAYDATNNQPLREGYNFQIKFQFTGSCTPTDFRFAADMIDQPEFGQPK
jgi:hypothetical protein